MRTFNNTVMTDVVMDVNINSSAVPLKNIFMYSIAAIYAGTPTGAIKLQASNDPETNDTNPSSNPTPVPTHWVDIADSSFALTSAGETMWNVRDVAYNYVRVVYIDSSGGTSTATLTVVVNCKGV